MSGTTNADALQRALAFYVRGAFAEAADRCRQILAGAPDHFDARHVLALAQSSDGRHEDALATIDAALAQRPEAAPAWMNRGLILRRLGRFSEALQSCDAALALTPGDAKAHAARGNTLMDLACPHDALESYDRAVAIDPAAAESWSNRAAALRAAKQPLAAVESCDRALALRPGHPDTLNNKGVALQDLRRSEEALACYDRALARAPRHFGALLNSGLALLALERPQDAAVRFDAALALRPNDAEALYSRGWAALVMGDFDAGWAGYAHRWRRPDAETPRYRGDAPEWRGEDIDGKSILVFEEQGFGDVLLFSRYLPLLAARGARVTFLIAPALRRLFKSFEPTIRLIDAPGADATFDFQCALMTLPAAFETRSSAIPSHAPYLFPEAPRVTYWRHRLGDGGVKIGLCWQGNPNSLNDVGRFIPLRAFAPLAALAGVRLISLQTRDGLDQLRELPDGMRVETLGDDFDEGPDAFVEAAAVVASLDLVVTADTALAHLAGALGRPVWTLLKRGPDWRWMLGRDDTPWYPSMRLYRQTRDGDWNDVFARVARDIAAFIALRNGAALAIPGSIGELFDKISILDIKAERFCPDARRNSVLRERELLGDLAARVGPLDPEEAALLAELRRVNEAIWDVETALRQCEGAQEFGPEFVALARAVYRNNDRRAEIKKALNARRGSFLVEEKGYGN